MSPLKHQSLSALAAAAIPLGIAAAFAFQGTASAAPIASAHPAAGSVRQIAAHPGSRSLAATAHKRKPHRKHHRALPLRLRAYKWAVKEKGHPYVWGGTGPGFDCSGLVMMAYRHAGIHLPRTTTEMLTSRLLVWTRHPRKGDLAFYGTGHVELFRKWGYTYGAHDSGSTVSLVHYGWGWKPTAYYRVRVLHRPKHHRHKHKHHG